MDAVADIAAAVEWLADHDAVDGDRVVAKGGSYGGFVVLAALTSATASIRRSTSSRWVYERP